METGNGKQLYELAYHFLPSMTDADVQSAKHEIEQFIASQGGAVSFARDPEKVRLSYPINHQRTSYFGYVHFTIDVLEGLSQLDEFLRLKPSVMRSLVVKFEPDVSGKEAVLRKVKAESIQRKARPAEAPMTKEQKEEIDKQVEELIEKIT